MSSLLKQFIELITVYNMSVKVTINVFGLIKAIINVVVYYYGIFKSIIIDWGLIFILRF